MDMQFVTGLHACIMYYYYYYYYKCKD